MLEQKRLEEKLFMTPLKSKPVPVSCLKPRLSELQEASEKRKEQIRQESASKQAKPFSFWEKDIEKFELKKAGSESKLLIP